MRRWQITGYRLSQASGIDRSTIAKLVRGDNQSASWDITEKLANGFEQIDPIAKDAFIGALQRPDSAYPHLADNTIAVSWDRESPESIAAVLEVLDEYKLLDRERIKALEAKIAESGDEIRRMLSNTLEDFISSKMAQKRREQDGI